MLINKITNRLKRQKELPYQDVCFKGSHYPGQIKTMRLFYSLDILNELHGKEFPDLGYNWGRLVFLAEESGTLSSTGVDIDPAMIHNANWRNLQG